MSQNKSSTRHCTALLGGLESFRHSAGLESILFNLRRSSRTVTCSSLLFLHSLRSASVAVSSDDFNTALAFPLVSAHKTEIITTGKQADRSFTGQVSSPDIERVEGKLEDLFLLVSLQSLLGLEFAPHIRFQGFCHSFNEENEQKK